MLAPTRRCRDQGEAVMIQNYDQNYNHNRPDRLEQARTTDTSAVSGEVTPKPVPPNPEARRARGMARGLTLLTIQRDGEFRLGVKTGKGILDVTEAATLFEMHAPPPVDTLLQNENGPSLNALVDAALQSHHSEGVFLDETGLAYGPVVTR